LGSTRFDGSSVDRSCVDAAWQGSRHGRGIWHGFSRQPVWFQWFRKFPQSQHGSGCDAVFFTSLSLTYLYSHPTEKLGVMDKVNPDATQVAPVAPAIVPADDSKSKDIPK
jgi:hypothetical protein